MGSTKGATKEIDCFACGKVKVTLSLYAPKSQAICPNCGGKGDFTTAPETAPEDLSQISRPAKNLPVRKYTKEEKRTMEIIKDLLDIYEFWEWHQVPLVKVTLKQLDELGSQGWKYAFCTDKHVLLQRWKGRPEKK